MEEMRLQKFIANSGVCSRRKAEEYILAGKVKVNGKIVTELGTKVDPQKDEVIFNNKKIEQNNWKVIIWTIFIQNAEELKDYLSLNWIKSELLIGKILQEDREIIIKKFNDTLNSYKHERKVDWIIKNKPINIGIRK